MSECKVCGRTRSPFVMNNKQVCLNCDDLLFDIEIECDDETFQVERRTESTKEIPPITKVRSTR